MYATETARLYCAAFSIASAQEGKPTHCRDAASKAAMRMGQPSSNVQQALLAALRHVEQSPDLSPEEVEWIRHFAARLITELAVSKSEQAEDDDLSPPDPKQV